VTGTDAAAGPDADPEGITFTTNGTVNVVAATIENFNLHAGSTGSGSNTITAGAEQASITGAAGNDTVNVASNTAAATLLARAVKLGAGTADTINVTGNTATGTITLSANVTGVEAITFANVDTDVTLVTNNAQLAAGEATALTITAASLTSGKMSFDGKAETGAFGYTVTLANSTGADTLIGGAGNDVFNAGNGANVFTGNAGADSVTGGTVVDTVYGDNSGNKTAYATANVSIAGSPTGATTVAVSYLGLTTATTAVVLAGANPTADEIATAIRAAANNDAVIGKLVSATGTAAAVVFTSLIDGNNTTAPTVTITPTGGAATYTAGAATAGTAGTAGADTVNAGGGNDVIIGGGGNDALTGSTGNDTFFFLKALSVLGSMATLTDYRASGMGTDTIVLGDVTAAIGTVATVQDFSSQASLGAALNAAANGNTQDNGLVVFMWGGNTYLYVETAQAGTSYVAGDFVVMITGTPFNTSTALNTIGFDGLGG
jgi:Ca2+-binding RTX toxin-like protein